MHQTTNKQTPVLDSCKYINISPIRFISITVGAHGLIIPPKPLQNSSYVSQLKIVINVSNWKLLKGSPSKLLSGFFAHATHRIFFSASIILAEL